MHIPNLIYHIPNGLICGNSRPSLQFPQTTPPLNKRYIQYVTISPNMRAVDGGKCFPQRPRLQCRLKHGHLCQFRLAVNSVTTANNSDFLQYWRQNQAIRVNLRILYIRLLFLLLLLMITLIFHGIIINLLLLFRLPYFVSCLLVFCALLRTRANFVIGLWAVKFART
jgi:hypothetical protein